MSPESVLQKMVSHAGSGVVVVFQYHHWGEAGTFPLLLINF